ncbi:hypothetical protein [Flavilitoribacter nigricans]|nr:hypothetical protein [Flavilitoribacter nigricans]
MIRIAFFFILSVIMLSCGDSEPPFPGTPPERAIYGTLPPTVNPDAWFRDVKHWGAETYIYHSPHHLGNAYRQQAGVSTDYDGADLKQVAFLSELDPAFATYLNADERKYQEQLVLEAYNACRAQELNFYYALPFPVFPVQDTASLRAAHPDWLDANGRLDLADPAIVASLPKILEALQAAMPELKGVSLKMGRGNGNIFELATADLDRISEWLPPLLQTFSESCKVLGLQGMLSAESIWHTNKTRREAYEIFNRYPDIMMLEPATWPEETTLMPFWGFVAPGDTARLDNNPVAVDILTDTEFLGQGQLPIVLPRWWQYLAQQTYLQDVELAIGRAFQRDQGGSVNNFNRLNLQLLMRFLEDPRQSLKPTLHAANEAMFGDDFPSRLTSIMLIAEDAIQAMSSVNSVNLLDNGHFPPPQFLDRDYLEEPLLMKGIDDLFEPPGTPLYPEETEQPDTLSATVHWRWQMEISARPVDEYLLTIENAINWLDRIQKEVQYLTLDFRPDQREMFVGGYRDLLLMARGMYQFVQGAAVHHRWYRLQRMSREEALLQLAPIAEQLRLIADEAGDSPMELQTRLLNMARAFETLEISPLGG